MKQILTIVVLFGCLAFCCQAQVKKTYPLQLVFQNYFGDSVLQQGQTYTNSFGEPLTISNFKYYVSHMEAGDSAGRFFPVSKEVFLVDELDSASKNIQLMVTVASIKKIRFLLGVDSLKNVSGVQTGTLDPLKGMFWIWNSGYIMAKLEGNSSASSAPADYVTYHIGGYKKGENTARVIELNLPMNNAASVITIKADAAKWFKSVHDIKIAVSPICHSPGALAVKIADNYSTMFSIANVN